MSRMLRRGDIHWVAFGHPQGGEIHKTRPAIIVSNDAANKHLNRVQVIPITSNIDKIYPSEARLVINGRAGKAMADQLTTVSVQRIKQHMATANLEEMKAVEDAIRFQLGLIILQ